MAHVTKVWNGSSWVTGLLKVWNGSSWVEKPKYWNGGAWIDLFPTAGSGVNLSGTTGAPNIAQNTNPSVCVAGWQFNTAPDGYDSLLMRTNNSPGYTQFGTEWYDGTNTTDYWMRATLHDGTSPSSNMNTWLKISGTGSSLRGLTLTRIGPPGTTWCILKFEISTSATGSPVVATGYYKINAITT